MVAHPSVARRLQLTPGVRRLEVRMRSSILLSMCVAVLGVGAEPYTHDLPAFREAADDAGSIVRVRVTAAEGVTLHVVEVIRGRDVPKTIEVARDLWEIHRPKKVTQAEVTYLVLLRTGGELLCGHSNGLIIIDHTCPVFLPVVDDKIPVEYAHLYYRDATEAIELRQVRKDLGKRK
jgi:hypothetical protein